MKRNITVNLFGTLYPIDEDAYSMLNSYIVNMRDYFSRRPDGKEIADDIEARVAELMSELRQSGVEAISIEHIEEIIGRIGSPEQLGVDMPAVDSDDVTDDTVVSPDDRRRLFRDPDHKLIGGVLAGLGCYFGINPLWLRLAALLLLVPTYGVIVLVYVICWASIPKAITPAERLQMKGEPINVSSLCEEFLSSTREMINRHGDEVANPGFISGIGTLFKVIIYAVCVLFLVVCVIALVGILISVVCALVAPWGELRDILGVDFPMIRVYDSNPLWMLWLCGISLVVFLAMTLYLGMHFFLHLVGRIPAMSKGLRISCVVLWVISLIVFSASWTHMVSNVGIRYGSHAGSRAEMEADRDARERRYLENTGWTLVRGEGVDNVYTRQGGHYSGSDKIRYLHANDRSGGMDMEYEVVRHMKVAPGLYRLEAAGRTDGKGAEIFAVNGKGQRLSAPIPAFGSKGGDIWQNARRMLEADSACVRADRNTLDRMVKAYGGKGSGWSRIIVDDISVGPDSILTYGVTNRSLSIPWEGTWLSAASFELVRKD